MVAQPSTKAARGEGTTAAAAQLGLRELPAVCFLESVRFTDLGLT